MKMPAQRSAWLWPGLLLFLLAACRPIVAPSDAASAPSTPPVTAAEATPVAIDPAPALSVPFIVPLDGFIETIHDPVMAKEGDTYYVFSSGARIISICSKDMQLWEWCGRVFAENPDWARGVNPDAFELWAPDISFWNDKWHLYYSVSSMGSRNSAIGLATNVTLDPASPDYAWVDQGIVIASQEGGEWNAIDPNLAFDETGQPWLAFGSYWSGLKLRKIDTATGLLDGSDETLYPLARRTVAADGTESLEGAFIIRHDDYFYLFASFDACCRGVESTYNVRVGRSAAITGPYLDREGKPMLEGGGTLILSAYGRWRGPGHNGIFTEDGIDYIVYHAYDAKQVGKPKLQIEAMAWDEEGWPVLASQSAP
jgi:arabinan endo-1,5-alpha-L-arabinosidase